MVPRKIKEADDWSPAQKDVDTYINSLEHQFLAHSEYMPDRPGDKDQRAASTKNRPSSSYTLFWGLMAMAVGCFWLLARVILKAVN